jgi:hypothetical protein
MKMSRGLSRVPPPKRGGWDRDGTCGTGQRDNFGTT